MPVFPNINTLSLKDILSGKETIQISASEKTTLEKIAQLALDQPIANFVPFLESLGGTMINSNDSLLVVLEKLYTRAGADKSNLFPVASDVYFGIGGILYQGPAVQSNQGNYLLIALIFDTEEGMKPYLWYGFRDMSPSESNSSPNAILTWLESEGKKIPLSSPDELLKVSSNVDKIELRPGQVVTCDEYQPNFVLNSNHWVKDTYVYGGQNFTASIVSRANITQKKFTTLMGVTPFPGAVELLFMEDFDIDPGTTWQAVTVQLFRAGNVCRFFINKCGYNSMSS